MRNSRNSFLLLKGVIALGGIFEGVMGVIILLWGDVIISTATQMQIIPNYPLFWRVLGLLAIALGSLQLYASFQPEKHVIIPLVACCVRFFLPVLTIAQIIDTPSMSLMLMLSTLFDLFLALVTVFLLVQSSIITKESIWKKGVKV